MSHWSTVGAKRVSKTVTNSPRGAFIALTAEHLEGWSPPARNRHHSPAPVGRLILYFCTQYIHIRRSQNVDDFLCPRPARELDCILQLPPSTAASSRIPQRSGTERAGSVPHRLREAPTRTDRPSVHPRGAALPPSSSFFLPPDPKPQTVPYLICSPAAAPCVAGRSIADKARGRHQSGYGHQTNLPPTKMDRFEGAT